MPRHTIAAPTAKAERIRASNTPKPAEHFLPLDGRQVQQLVFLSAGITDATSHYCGSNCEGGTYPGEQYAKASGTFSEIRRSPGATTGVPLRWYHRCHVTLLRLQLRRRNVSGRAIRQSQRNIF